ncbi:hypothetical protein [Nitratireductor sp. ZSWI3]|uniref:hypothetical protein n=1 Tax=Nitratireductor sp. ZSWI3 TaxID=2966359 RepID=UPI0021504414|nr:hypothetical protein [Nitratireductor sp. ZSWI3]MCR4267765.1 hypothetical protein [Nitratireductor sp. ZSWI3]
MKRGIIGLSAAVGLAGLSLSGCVNHAASPEYNGSYFIWQAQNTQTRNHYPSRDYSPPNK